MKNRFQGVIFREDLLGKCAVLFLVEIGVAEWFDRGGEVDGFFVVLHVEVEGCDVIPKSGIGKDGVHSLVTVVVDAAHEIGCDADLNAMQLRDFKHFIQRVGDQVFAAAGKTVAGRRSRNADKGQFAQESDIFCRIRNK